MKTVKLIGKGLVIASMGAFLASCGGGEEIKPTDPKKDDSSAAKPITNPPIGKYDNAIFSIPSPIMLSSIIADNGAAFDSQLLNPSNKSDSYVTVESQALNLGIYGADLGYTTLYDHSQEALKYMKASKKLADALNISEAFDQETISQIERNLGNKDSLLYLVSNSYRKADEFLQIRDRKHIGALIIVGGWIESLHFAAQIGSATPKAEISKLIGQQKHTLETILDKMLVKYVDSDGVEELYNDLEDIRSSFEEVNIEYTYAKPVHDKENKVSELNGTTTVDISEEVFKEISKKISLLRKKIIL